MSSIAKANISLSKKDLTKSRIPLVASRNVVFYHKATVGDLSINLLALVMPSAEIPTAVQATAAEISGTQLYTNKKNLNLISSTKGNLIQGMDYVVTSGSTISLIGPYEGFGAEIDEIFIGTINSAPISDLVVASAKSVTKTYELAVGATTLNLGYEYQTGVNPNDDVGIIKVFVNGVLAHRGVDYAEVDAGSGYGTTIEFYAAPVSLPYQIAVDFGVMAITDNNGIGAIESLSGAVKKIADDLAVLAGTNADDYLNANPSEIERRTFGDAVLSLDSKYDTTQNLSTYTKTKFQKKNIGSFGSWTPSVTLTGMTFNNLIIGKIYRLSFKLRHTSTVAAANSISFDILNGSASILDTGYFATEDGNNTTTGAHIFIATATTLSFISGASISNVTHTSSEATLEELPNHELTTQWT